MPSYPKLLSLVSLATLIVAGCAADTDEETEEAEADLNGTYSRPDGRKLEPSEVARLVREAGFPETVVGTMVCTALHESSFFERALNDKHNKNGSIDRGLFQINSINLGLKGCPSTPEPLFDAVTNTKCAFAVYKMFQRKDPDPRRGIRIGWAAYRKHDVECDAFPAPDGADAIPTTTDPDDETETTLPTEKTPGSCWAGTLGAHLESGGCYQRKSDGLWFQCKDSQLFRNVKDGVGPFGTCSSVHPLSR